MNDRTDQLGDDLASRLPLLEQQWGAFFARHIPERHDVEDLVSEVKLRLVHAVTMGKAIGDPGAFAYGIATNLRREYFRARKQHDRRFFAVAGTGASVAAADDDADADLDERLRALQQCLTELPAQDRTLLLAFYAASDDKAAARAELAERWGLTINALYIRASRLRARLRECFGQHGLTRPAERKPADRH